MLQEFGNLEPASNAEVISGLGQGTNSRRDVDRRIVTVHALYCECLGPALVKGGHRENHPARMIR